MFEQLVEGFVCLFAEEQLAGLGVLAVRKHDPDHLERLDQRVGIGDVALDLAHEVPGTGDVVLVGLLLRRPRGCGVGRRAGGMVGVMVGGLVGGLVGVVVGGRRMVALVGAWSALWSAGQGRRVGRRVGVGGSAGRLGSRHTVVSFVDMRRKQQEEEEERRGSNAMLSELCEHHLCWRRCRWDVRG